MLLADTQQTPNWGVTFINITLGFIVLQQFPMLCEINVIANCPLEFGFSMSPVKNVKVTDSLYLIDRTENIDAH